MNNTKITFSGEVTSRWQETTKAGKEMFYLAVEFQDGKYKTVFKVKARDKDSIMPYKKGSKVTCEAFVGGREWKSPEGKMSYFTDINLYSIKEDSPEANNAEQAFDEAESSNDEEMPF